MSGSSISSRKGAGSLGHNNRDWLTKNVDPERVKDNIIYIQKDIKEVYREVFGSAVEEYNLKQENAKHAERKIQGENGYYNKIAKDKNGKKLFYEHIFQIGTMDDTPAMGWRDSEKSSAAVAALDEFARNFQERNPHLKVFNAVMHLDEATPHLHIDYIPVAECRRGMNLQNGLAQALKQQGCISAGEKGKRNNETMTWLNREKAELKQIAEEHGIQIETVGGEPRGYQPSDEYKLQKRCEALETRIESLESDLTIADERIALGEEIIRNKDRVEAEARQKAIQAQKAENERLLAEKEIAALNGKKTALESELKTLTTKVNQVTSALRPAKRLDVPEISYPLLGGGATLKFENKKDAEAAINAIEDYPQALKLANERDKVAEAYNNLRDENKKLKDENSGLKNQIKIIFTRVRKLFRQSIEKLLPKANAVDFENRLTRIEEGKAPYNAEEQNAIDRAAHEQQRKNIKDRGGDGR